MARSIKKISHDMLPLALATAETSLLVQEALKRLESFIQFNQREAKDCFEFCIEACEKMAISADLMKQYVLEVDNEAESEGITKG